MKVLAFAASSSKKSINKKLAGYVASLIPDARIDLIDLNNFEMPLFSEDRKAEIEKPPAIDQFLTKIAQADLVIVSFAEHNGSYTAAYKNLFDWCSTATKKVYENKKMILLSTSSGPGGAKSVLESAVKSMPFFGAQVIASLSIPRFYENFDHSTMKPNNIALANQLLELVKVI